MSFRIADDEEPLAVTVSIGVATGAAGEVELNDLLERADQALYTAKNAGRNRVEVAADTTAVNPLPEAARA
mgnify:FL=1